MESKIKNRKRIAEFKILLMVLIGCFVLSYDLLSGRDILKIYIPVNATIIDSYHAEFTINERTSKCYFPNNNLFEEKIKVIYDARADDCKSNFVFLNIIFFKFVFLLLSLYIIAYMCYNYTSSINMYDMDDMDNIV